MEVSNTYAWKQKPRRSNEFFLPSSMRAVIVGSSSCGKTVLLLNLLLNDALDYNKLYIYARSLFQEQYQIIIKGFQKGFSKSQMRIIFENQMSLDKMLEFIHNYNGLLAYEIQVEYSEKVEDIPDPANFDPANNHLVIFDDVMNDRQANIMKYYTRGRLSNIDSIYLSQSYFHLDRRSIRQNSNLFLIFEQNGKNLQHIFSDLAGTHMNFHQFREFAVKIWSKKYAFITIDHSKPPLVGRFRRNLDDYYVLNNTSFHRIGRLEDERELRRKVMGLYQQIQEDELPDGSPDESPVETDYQTATNSSAASVVLANRKPNMSQRSTVCRQPLVKHQTAKRRSTIGRTSASKRYRSLRYQCDMCSKTFAHRQSLFKHRKICKCAQTSTVPTVIDSNSPRFDGKQHPEDIQDTSPIPDLASNLKMCATIINNGGPLSPEPLEILPADQSDANEDKEDTVPTSIDLTTTALASDSEHHPSEILPSGNYGVVDWFKQNFWGKR